MDHRCPLDKEKYPLSTQILNYYFKYGQHRNLERYLKPARSKSSSEGSLSVAPNKYVDQLTKSLENVSALHKQREQEEQAAEKSAEKPVAGEKVSPKKDEETSRKKSKQYQFVIDSNVNITIPFNQPVTTDAKLQTEPVRAVTQSAVELTSAQDHPKHQSVAPASPTSSVISNKQRLEWDSLGDVGYEFCNLTETQMKPEEKSVLQKFFTERGLQMNQPLILLSPNIKAPKHQAIPGTSKEEEPKERKNLEKASQIDFEAGEFAQSTPKNVQEQSSQTTLKEFLNKYVQAEKAKLQEKKDVPETSQSRTDLQETRGSFEFFGPALLQTNKENISPSSTLKSNTSKNSSGEELRAHISSYLAASVRSGHDDFQQSLKRATSLVNLLMDSKSIPSVTKKELVKKIFEKLEKSYTKNQSASRSEISTSTNSNSRQSRQFYVDEFQKSEFLKEWLKPLTNVSGEEKPQENLQSRKSSRAISEASQKSLVEEASRNSSRKINKSDQEAKIHEENIAKEIQLLRIEQEIKHLQEIRMKILEERTIPILIESESLRSANLSLTNASSWNSHCNMKQFKNRSKLKTPSDKSSTRGLLEGLRSLQISGNESSISSGKYYSEPIEINYQGNLPSKSKSSPTPHSTTISSVSRTQSATPSSSSQPVKAPLRSIQTQTYDSITTIVNPPVNKQQQTKLDSIAYIITLDKGADSRGVKHVQEYLVENHPEFVQSANERKTEIELQRQERQRRNHEREKMLKAKTLPITKLNSLLKPLRHSPKSNCSVIYKQRTRKKYHNLAEVVKKREMQKVKTYKENVKLLQMVFNKNLQRKTLQGEINIPHSKCVVKSI
ncbi:hypothetical protein DMENIID0001_079270 [Sergentomyia squamirostris]